MSRARAWAIWLAQPPNSWPSRTGIASIRCVRPGLDHPVGLVRLRLERFLQMFQCWQQFLGDQQCCADVNGGRE